MLLHARMPRRALEVYWKQARNTEAERKAADIRLRAERRAGELLIELDRATPQQVAAAGGNAKAGNVLKATVADSSPYSEALKKSNISPRTATRYQQLANIPAEDFEQALADPASKPTTRGLIREIRNPIAQVIKARAPNYHSHHQMLILSNDKNN